MQVLLIFVTERGQKVLEPLCETSWGGTNCWAWKHFMRSACSASLVNHRCRERAWIFRKLHWPKWRKQPRISARWKLEERALYIYCHFKVYVTVSGAIHGRCCSNKRRISLYTASDLFFVAAYTNGTMRFWLTKAHVVYNWYPRGATSNVSSQNQLAQLFIVQYIQIILRRIHVKPVLMVFVENEVFAPRCHVGFIH